MSSALPVEIRLMIATEIFESQESIPLPRHHFDGEHDLLHRARRTERLRTFRDLASTCKAWLDAARTVFWTEVTLFNVSDLVVFARTVEDSSDSKPACIRRIYFRFTESQPEDSLHPSPTWEDTVSEVQPSFIVVFRHLPVHLDVFHVNCDQTYFAPYDILYACLQAACRDRTFIQVAKLDIDAPVGIRDVFSYFTFAHNIVHLVLTVTCRLKVFNTPIPSMQLESLVLRIMFAGGPRYKVMSLSASDVARVLRPACMTLQSLALILYGCDDSSEPVVAETMKHLLSLTNPSMSVLRLCVRPDYAPTMTVGQELADADAFPPYPALQYLHLDEFSVTPDVFRRMGCSRLRQLEVTSPAGFEADTVQNIMASMDLKELENLQDLVINFGGLEASDDHSLKSRSLQTSMRALETACASRNIACRLEVSI